MVKRIFPLFLALFLALFSSCAGKGYSANHIESMVLENEELILSAVEEMKALGFDRVYVAIENIAEKDDPEEMHLAYYEKESEDRISLDNEILEEVINVFGLKLILYQTSSDGRNSVIFSYSKENDESTYSQGFYYSFDSLPCAWWGRYAKLKSEHGRYIEINDKSTAAWYSTVPIKDNIYYFEKSGYLAS